MTGGYLGCQPSLMTASLTVKTKKSRRPEGAGSLSQAEAVYSFCE